MDNNKQIGKVVCKHLVKSEAEMNRPADYMRLFSEIDGFLSKGSVIVAIDGGSASGKTTLASKLQEVYDCNVFHMDDFFLQAHQRTPERLNEVGGNVDRERFQSEVLQSLKKGETVYYRRFDCQTQALEVPVTVEPKKLTIIEGAYSMHPAFSNYYDLGVFLDIDPEHQKQRILKRNSTAMAERFFGEWIPMENTYFSETKIKDRCDLIINV